MSPRARKKAAATVPPKAATTPKPPFVETPLKWGGPNRNGHEEEQTYRDLETGELSTRIRVVPPDAVRCVAIVWANSSPWKGNRCTCSALHGMKVCRSHGGSLPNVKKSAQAKLAIAALPAAERLIHIALTKKHVSDKDRIRALMDILDRAGVSGKTTIELEIKPWQKVLQSIYGSKTDPNEPRDGAVVELEEGTDYMLPDSEPPDDDDDED